MVTFGLGIPSCGEGKRGENATAVMKSALETECVTSLRAFTEKMPNWQWADTMWRWGEEVSFDATHFITIQDDVKLHPEFWGIVHNMVTHKPDKVICLQTAHPASIQLRAEGKSWMTTADGLVGVAYILPISLLKEFNEWRAGANQDFVKSQTEDTLLAFWCVLTGRRIWHPIPTPIQHDLSLESTYGNDSHAMRKTLAGDVEGLGGYSDGMRWRDPGSHIGRIHDFSPIFALYGENLGGTLADYMSDTGAAELKRLRHSALASRPSAAPSKSILICTPSRGGVHPEYAASIWRLLKTEMCDFELASEVYDVQSWQSDVVRTRSALVAYFLQKTQCTHLLFLDADVAVTPDCVRGMLMSGHDFVAAPYPRRDSVDFGRVQGANRDAPADAAAYKYSIHTLPEGISPGPDACAEIEGIGLGCALLSRDMLQLMSDQYSELTFTARGPDGQPLESVALFQLELSGGKLYSEDYSFCRLWRRTGKVMMYLGNGSPVDHYGEHKYRGVIESFGLRRVQR